MIQFDELMFQMGRFNHQHPILISDFHSLIPYHPFIALVHPDLAKLGCPTEGDPGSWPKGGGIPGNPPWATAGAS